jgi:hypothetical protein
MPVDYGKTEVMAPAGQIATREQIVALMKGRFFEFRGVLVELRDASRSIIVDDDAGLDSAETLRGKIKSAMTQIENRRKDVTNPLVEDKREVDAFANNLKADCAMIIKAIDDVTNPYLIRKEKERKEKAAEQQRLFEEQRRKSIAEAAAEAEAAQKRAAELAEKGEPPADAKTEKSGSPLKPGDLFRKPEVTQSGGGSVLIPEIVPTETKVSTSAGSAKVEVERIPEVVNLAAVCTDQGFIQARAKWLEEQALIYARQSLKMGVENIPGVVFKDVPVVKRRSR